MKIQYQLPDGLEPQNLTVTLKSASLDPNAKVNTRLHREVVKVTGRGETEIDLMVPAELKSDAVRVATWIGAAYETNLQYYNSKPIPVE